MSTRHPGRPNIINDENYITRAVAAQEGRHEEAADNPAVDPAIDTR
jgi:hypothetical protein